MERLQFGPGSTYAALEAAHHLARYRLVKDLCRGKRVLDAACGEGYGSFLMADWGADVVVGVDNSPSAIESAQRTFKRDNVSFILGNCEQLAQVAEPASFDLVVSFETLEHVENIGAYLASLKEMAGDGGAIVISCPNDHWAYKHGGNNVFHKHRLSLQDFQSITKEVLGEARSWHRGTLALGFSIVAEGRLPTGGPGSTQELMLSYQEVGAPVLVPAQIESAAADKELFFYVGVWGNSEVVSTLVSVYPVSMELTRRPLFPYKGVWSIKPNPNVLSDETHLLQHQVIEFEAQLDAAREETRKAQMEARSAVLRARATQAENDLLLQRLAQQNLPRFKERSHSRFSLSAFLDRIRQSRKP